MQDKMELGNGVRKCQWINIYKDFVDGEFPLEPYPEKHRSLTNTAFE